MSTRSNIVFVPAKGKVSVIYCHSDGYPSYNGRILLESYKTVERVKELVGLGDLSVLGPDIGVKHDFDWMMTINLPWDLIEKDPRAQYCRAYKRDRGEKGTQAKKYSTLEKALERCDNDYTYVFTEKTGRWTYRDSYGALKRLTKSICEND